MRTYRLKLSLFLILLLAACTGPLGSDGINVWIDVPRDGVRISEGESVQIEGHAAYGEGVARIEIWVNEDLHLVEENPPVQGSLVSFAQSWMPPGSGEYTIEVIAIGTDGTSSRPDTVRISVGEPVAEVTLVPSPTPVSGASPTPVASVTPVITPTIVPSVTPPPAPPTHTPVPATPTFTPVPGAIIDLWADSEQIPAGSCTSIHWHVEHVQAVFFDGLGVTGDGYQQVCPCEDETHTLTVTLPDGTQQDHNITIRVSGDCVTPTPTDVPDATAPPAPSPDSPTGGEVLDCAGHATLRWDAVSDPSGISVYQVQVERHSGDNNWQVIVNNAWQNLTAVEVEIEIECGWYYRWRVRAVDGAGNTGAYSGWAQFSVTLT